MLVSATVALRQRIDYWADGLVGSANDDVVAEMPGGASAWIEEVSHTCTCIVKGFYRNSSDLRCLKHLCNP
jgi:hypothetical protein